MTFSLLDRSNYLRGLLILIGKDRKITREEKILFRKLSKELGFNKEFCENALKEYLVNKYLNIDPPKFSDIEIAKLFIQDGIKLAFADKELNHYEIGWLKSVADTNKINHNWSLEQYKKYYNNFENLDGEFEITKFLNKYAQITVTSQTVK